MLIIFQVRVTYEVLFERQPGEDYTACASTTEIFLENGVEYTTFTNLSSFSPSQCDHLTLQGRGFTPVARGYFCPNSDRVPTAVTIALGRQVGVCCE